MALLVGTIALAVVSRDGSTSEMALFEKNGDSYSYMYQNLESEDDDIVGEEYEVGQSYKNTQLRQLKRGGSSGSRGGSYSGGSRSYSSYSSSSRSYGYSSGGYYGYGYGYGGSTVIVAGGYGGYGYYYGGYYGGYYSSGGGDSVAGMIVSIVFCLIFITICIVIIVCICRKRSSGEIGGSDHE